MTGTLYEAILAALDLPEGTRYSPEDAVDMAGALQAVLDIHSPEKLLYPADSTVYCGCCLDSYEEPVKYPCGTVQAIVTALGVSTEPAQPTRQWAVEHPSWETVVHHSITSALYTFDHAPLGDRARLVTRMSDQTEWVPCGRDGEPLPAQAEPRVWQPMDTAPRDGTTILGRYDGVQVVDIRWSEERVCMLASVAPGAGMFGPGWEDVANGLYIDNPEAWMPLPEVTDQAGEA